MFAVLKNGKTGSVFRKLKIRSQRVTLPGNDAFFVVTLENFRGKASLKKLEDCLGILKKDVLVSGDMPLTEGTDITVFSPDILPRLLLINSASDTLKGCRYKSLILYDEKGIYTHCTAKLTDSFDRIRVVTPFTQKYEEVSRKLMENYGFSLEVSSCESFGADVIISHSCRVPLYYSGIVFTNERKYLMNSQVFSGKEITLPDPYEDLRPENTDTLIFASALYEKCGITDLGKLKYTDFGC